VNEQLVRKVTVIVESLDGTIRKECFESIDGSEFNQDIRYHWDETGERLMSNDYTLMMREVRRGC